MAIFFGGGGNIPIWPPCPRRSRNDGGTRKVEWVEGRKEDKFLWFPVAAAPSNSSYHVMGLVVVAAPLSSFGAATYSMKEHFSNLSGEKKTSLAFPYTIMKKNKVMGVALFVKHPPFSFKYSKEREYVDPLLFICSTPHPLQ